MFTRKVTAVLAAAPLALSLAAMQPGFSAEGKGDAKKGTNVDPAKRATSPQADAVVLGALADQLVEYGDKNKDAMALITAARIQSQIGAQDEKREKKTEGGKPAGKDDKGAAPKPRDLSVSGILDRAKQYAGGRKDLIALADEAAKSGTRGAAGGPKNTVTDVRARATDVFNVTFRGGEAAVVAISGDGDTDLDLFVKDESGNVICRAQSASDDEICRWTPRWTGVFRLEVRNLGGVHNRYRIWTN